jgi:hypothetical protein
VCFHARNSLHPREGLLKVEEDVVPSPYHQSRWLQTIEVFSNLRKSCYDSSHKRTVHLKPTG